MAYLSEDPKKKLNMQGAAPTLGTPPPINMGPTPAQEIGGQLASGAASKAIGLGANSLAQGAAGTAGQAVAPFLGGSATGTTLGTALGVTPAAGAAGAGAAGAAGAGAAGLAAVAPYAIPALIAGKAFGFFNDGTTNAQAPDDIFGDDPLVQQANLNNPGSLATSLIHGADMLSPYLGALTGMFVSGKPNQQDTIPAMVTEGEAIIPAPAAQHPKNKKAISQMVQEGRAANRGAPIQPPMMAGPLSMKQQNEQMKSMQDMSLKKKSWLADEKRKQEAHTLKMNQMQAAAIQKMQ